MPLLDHFRPPFADRRSWEGFHGQWTAMIVIGLSRKLPQRYVAEPRDSPGLIHRDRRGDLRGGGCRFPFSRRAGRRRRGRDRGLGSAAADLDIATDLGSLDEYEVRVYDTRLAIGSWPPSRSLARPTRTGPNIVVPFVAKWPACFRHQVCVAIVDLVTTRHSNLYSDLMELIGQTDPSLGDEPPVLLCRRLSLEEDVGTAGLLENLDASPRAGPVVADPAALARREPGGPAGVGAELRGDAAASSASRRARLSRSGPQRNPGCFARTCATGSSLGRRINAGRLGRRRRATGGAGRGIPSASAMARGRLTLLDVTRPSAPMHAAQPARICRLSGGAAASSPSSA